MTAIAVARTFYRALRGLSRTATKDVEGVWRDIDPRDVTGSWRSTRAEARLTASITASQLSAARLARQYVQRMVAEQGRTHPPTSVLHEQAFGRIASDGRSLDSLLRQPMITTVARLNAGMPDELAMESGRTRLAMIAATQVADMGRSATEVAMVADPRVSGWVRMLNPPSCGRCAILAGRIYRWSDGFERHPACDCVHAPAVEDVPDDLRTDPQVYFDSLSKAEQDKYFGRVGAEAIRQGANMGQVVNASRGASGLSRPGRLTAEEQRALRGGRSRGRVERVDVYGRQLAITTEGTTRRGIAGKRLIAVGGSTRDSDSRVRRAKTPRLMPAAIAEIANGDRAEQVHLLRLHGYIL